MSDNPLNDLIRAQQSGLIGLQSQRITQLEAELRKAEKRIRDLEAKDDDKALLTRLVEFANRRNVDRQQVLDRAQKLKLEGRGPDEILHFLEREANC